MFHRLLRAEGQGKAAKTVEVFGWLILAEGGGLLLVPQLAVTLLHLPALGEQAENYFRLVGLLVGGLGMLYVASGRLNAQGFVFASLLDRPLVPPVMFVLWLLGIVPGPAGAGVLGTGFRELSLDPERVARGASRVSGGMSNAEAGA